MRLLREWMLSVWRTILTPEMTLPSHSPSLGPTERSYLAVLAEAQRRGLTMTRTKVAKLLYLADLEMTREKGRQATEIHWKWLNHGPFDNSLFDVEEMLRWAHLVEADKTQNYYGTLEVRLELGAGAENLAEIFGEDAPAARVVAEVVDKWGGLSASALRDLTYRTDPMIKAQASDARGEELDLDMMVEPPSEGVIRAFDDLTAKVRELPEQETESGAMDDLEDEVNGLRRARTKANRELLG
jgi:uncharacterized phage-associated protein